MSSNKKLAILLKGIIQENPVLILVLGTCPTLATTTSVISALSMGLAATFVLVCSNIVISALRKIIPDTVRIPCYIVIIAGFLEALAVDLPVACQHGYERLAFIDPHHLDARRHVPGKELPAKISAHVVEVAPAGSKQLHEAPVEAVCPHAVLRDYEAHPLVRVGVVVVPEPVKRVLLCLFAQLVQLCLLGLRERLRLACHRHHPQSSALAPAAAAALSG